MGNIENMKDLIIYQSQNNENISVEVLYDAEEKAEKEYNEFNKTQKIVSDFD